MVSLNIKDFTTLVRDQVTAIQGRAAGLVDFTIGSLLRAITESNASLGVKVVSRNTNQITPMAVSLSSAVPINALSCSGILNGSSTVATTVSTAVWTDSGVGDGDGDGDGQQSTVSGATKVVGVFRDLVIGTPQQIYYTVQALAGSTSFIINVTKYTF